MRNEAREPGWVSYCSPTFPINLFKMSDEDEWIEEETLVVAELSGLIDTETIQKGNLKCHVLGIDTEKPVLQIDNYLFSGHYEDTLGTDLIFKAKPADSSKGEADSKNIEYHCMTTKKLVMQRTFLQNKNISEGAVSDTNEEEETVEEEGVSLRDEEEGDVSMKTEPVPSTSSAVILHTHTSRLPTQPARSAPVKLETCESGQSTSVEEDLSAASPGPPTVESSSSTESASKCSVSGSKSMDSTSTSTETQSTVSTEVQT